MSIIRINKKAFNFSGVFAFEKFINVLANYTMRHKFSNFQFIFKMHIGIKMKRNKIFNPLIFDALAITISNFHRNFPFL